MSSIERAMSKLAGKGDDGEGPDLQQTAVAAGAAPAEPAPTPSASEAPLAAPASPAPMADVELRPSDEADSVSASGIAPTSIPTADLTAHAAVPLAPAHAALPREAASGNYVHIDQERLAAGGFLTPDQSMTRQSEEFQHIKRRLLGNMVPGILHQDRPPNLILITSSVPGEGKTFISTNLAISIALEVDHTVLAIDTDIMKRDLSKVFGVVDRPGLFDLLSDPRLKLPDLLVRTSIPNLVILPAGNRREGSTELLASLRMKELTNEISARYHDRVVLFDSPPVLATTTATALAPLVGQVILVAEAGNTKHETIREALQRLDRVRITGVILNKSKQQSTPGYDYYGSYYQSRK